MAFDFFAGCLGGCAGVLVGHPFDTVKVHMQTQDPLQPKYRSTLHCMRTLIQKDSVAGLYRGLAAPLGGVAVVNALVFGAYGCALRSAPEPHGTRAHLCAGAAAGLAQSVVCSPLELAKTRLQVEAPGAGAGASGPLRVLAGVARREGVRAVWQGLSATAARDTVGLAVYFASYEWLSQVAVPTTPAGVPTPPISTGRVLLCGGLAGCISWFSSFPVDVVKTRLQVDGMDGPKRYAGFWDCVMKSLRVEGPGFLWRGLACTLLRAFPVNAATFGTVTWAFRLMEPRYKTGPSRPKPATAPAADPTLTTFHLCGAPLLLSAANPLHDALKERRHQLANLTERRRPPRPPITPFFSLVPLQVTVMNIERSHGVDQGNVFIQAASASINQIHDVGSYNQNLVVAPVSAIGAASKS